MSDDLLNRLADTVRVVNGPNGPEYGVILHALTPIPAKYVPGEIEPLTFHLTESDGGPAFIDCTFTSATGVLVNGHPIGPVALEPGPAGSPIDHPMFKNCFWGESIIQGRAPDEEPA